MQQFKIKHTHTHTHTHTYIHCLISQTESIPVPLHFQEIFTIITKDYKCSSKQARDFHAQAHKQETFNAQSQLKETSRNNLIK
jgi:hypothetical protein